VFAVEEKDDPHLEATWKKANPGYPISPTRRYLQSASTAAKNSPMELAAFQRLHLGIRTKQTTRFLNLRDWDRNAGARALLTDEAVRGREAYGGLDLASVSDLTSLCWLLPEPDAGYRALWRNWIPEAGLEALDKRTANAASEWVKQGWLTVTPGDVTDYDFVLETIKADAELLDVQSIGADPYNATHLSNQITEAGLPVVRVRQGFITLSPPMKEVQRLLLVGSKANPALIHGGNPVVRWAVDNLAVATDPAGNVKPDKASAGDKIDPVSALATAMSEALSHEDRARSAYDDPDSEVMFF
jgi:phage terminase large subunit-like protein